MTPFYPIDKLRKLPGLSNARYMDPYSGGKGNSVRYPSAAPRTDDMKVIGIDNLFCAGENWFLHWPYGSYVHRNLSWS